MTVGDTVGAFNYLAASVESSLERNGKVLTRRDPDGSDDTYDGVVVDARRMPVENARASAERPTLHANGFEMLERPLGGDLDFLDHARVVRTYYPECARVVQEATGASYVVAFDHNVRSASGKRAKRRIDRGQQVQGPAHIAHGDYTLRSGPERLGQLARPPSGNDTLRLLEDRAGEPVLDPARVERALAGGARFALINLWRNVADEPVATHPLALCDARTLSPEELVVFEIHYADRIGENYFCKHAPAHRWQYYPGLTRDEALLIKQWDSAGTLAQTRGERADGEDTTAPSTFSLHSAFEDPETPEDAPDRWSVEVRCAVLY